jgi:glycosyltransferase involved in cell wall biosynthesis
METEIEENVPLISALAIVTEQDHHLIPFLVSCFRAQTYPYKELLIVNNCNNQLEAANLITIAEPNIFVIDTPVRFTAGMASNYGLSAVNGTLIAHFGIDCYHSPQRLLSQALALHQNQVHLCVYQSIIKFSHKTGYVSRVTNEKGGIFQSLMYIRPKNIDYDNVDKLYEYSIYNKLISRGYGPIALQMPDAMIKLVGRSRSILPVRLGQNTTEQEAVAVNQYLSIL